MSQTNSNSEAAGKADFSAIRYAQCWEDADILLEGLDVQPGDTCLSIASAGDNALAMLARDAAKVIAIDLNLAQLHCLELRVQAYQILEHEELLQLVGSRTSDDRLVLYQKCRPGLGDSAQRFWDAHTHLVQAGIGSAGKFERYFQLFREWTLPLVHSQKRVDQLLTPKSEAERRDFYDRRWDTVRWRWLFRIFFSRFVMGRLGRDPRFFDYVQGSVGDRILSRARHALRELDPSSNPYLHWILRGTHGESLPFALRMENFDTIRSRLDRLEWRLCSVEEFCRDQPPDSVHRFNLSDIFEYMSEANYESLLNDLLRISAPHSRLAYWNMLAPRSRPERLASKLKPLKNLSERLHWQDKAFFYSRFVVEESL